MSEPAADPRAVPDEPPFIPHAPDEQPLPTAFWRVFGTRAFFRLWIAQVVAGLGDWVGIIAILALAARLSDSGAAVGFVMAARMIPGFILAPIGGALVDRWNRKTVMVGANLGRSFLLILLPFFDTLIGLVIFAFFIEVLTLLWGPAKDATVPNVVKNKEQLASANSLGLMAGFGTFPLGAIVFAALAGVAKWLGGFDALSFLAVEQESLAIWVNSGTFLAAAVITSRLDLPEDERRVQRIDWTQTFRDIIDGLRFIHSHPLVRGVMIALAGGLLGGGAMVPLGPVFARDVLGAGSAGFGLLMTALGIGAAIGVLTLLWFQRRLPRETVFVLAVIASGAAIIAAAAMSSLTPAMLLVALVGATAGTAYVTGFTVLQESVEDELRGRTFATLYTVVRLALLLSLTIGPFAAGGLDRVSDVLVDRSVELAGFTLPLPGVRLALWAGGGIAIASGLQARRSIRRARAAAAAGAGP